MHVITKYKVLYSANMTDKLHVNRERSQQTPRSDLKYFLPV